MKKQYKIPILLGFAFLVFGLVGCTEKQEVAAPISPDGYPFATYSIDKTEVWALDTFNVIITMDKMLDQPVIFTIEQTGGTFDYHHLENFDEDIHIDVEMPPFTDSIAVPFILGGSTTEGLLTMNLDVFANDPATRYLLNPKQEDDSVEVAFNSNDTTGLTMSISFTETDDIDMFGIFDNAGTLVDWLLAGSSANPEVFLLDKAPYVSGEGGSPDGTYYIGIDPYEVIGDSFDYVMLVGHPDQKIEQFSGKFIMANRDSYTKDFFAYWGVDSYRILEVVKTGETFGVTFVGP